MIRIVFFVFISLNVLLLILINTVNPNTHNIQAQKIITQINPSAVKIISENKEEDSFDISNNDVTFADNQSISTCVEANMSNEMEILFMQKELQNLLPSLQTKIISSTQSGSYMVYVKPSKNIKAQVANIRRSKISPISTGIIKQTPVVILGTFDTKPSALEYIDSIKGKGVKDLEIANIGNDSMNIFWLRLPYASITEEGLLRKIAARYGIFTRYCQ